MRQSDSASNIVDLTEARRARQATASQETAPAGHGRVVGAAGLVMLVASLAFGVNITYRAAQLDAMGDTFVLMVLAVTGGYFVISAIAVRLVTQMGGASSRGAARSSDAESRILPAVADDDGESVILEFRRRLSSSGPVTLRCAGCGSEYEGSSIRANCPSCGRTALAG